VLKPTNHASLPAILNRSCLLPPNVGHQPTNPASSKAAVRHAAAGTLVSQTGCPSINLEACRARERIPGVEFDLHCLELLFDQPQRIIAQE
jgi:hypothetical protein